MNDSELLEPCVDPKKKVIGYRNVVCENPAGGALTVVSVRDTADFVLDEPTERGGTNMGPTPVESVMGGLCGCDFLEAPTEMDGPCSCDITVFPGNWAIECPIDFKNGRSMTESLQLFAIAVR